MNYLLSINKFETIMPLKETGYKIIFNTVNIVLVIGIIG